MNEQAQVTRAELPAMTPEQIEKARAEGRLQGILSGVQEHTEAPEVPAGQLTRDDLKGMTPDAINAAVAEGKCDWIMGVQR